MAIDLSNIEYHIQPQFKWLFMPIKNSIIIAKSGRASGKSTSIAQRLIIRSFEQKGNTLVIQSTYSAMKDASFAELTGWISELGLEKCFRITTSPLSIVNIITGVKFIFRGTDKSDRIKSLKGIEIIWIEEADLIQEKDFDTIDLSARGFGYDVQFYLSFNPSSPFTWIKKYIDEPDKYDAYIHHSYYYDNPFLDKRFLNKMEMLKKEDPIRYKRDGLGEFTQAEGLCINNELIKDIRYSEVPKHKMYDGYGMDFGFNHPQAFVHCKYDITKNELYIMEVIAKSEKTNEEFTKELPVKYKNLKNCYADSANPDKIKTLNQSNFKFVGAKKDKLKVDAYIEFMNQLKTIYVTEKATYFKREAGKWSYIPDTDTPRKVDDDCNDGLRYSLQPILLERTYNNKIVGRNKRL